MPEQVIVTRLDAIHRITRMDVIASIWSEPNEAGSWSLVCEVMHVGTRALCVGLSKSEAAALMAAVQQWIAVRSTWVFDLEDWLAEQRKMARILAKHEEDRAVRMGVILDDELDGEPKATRRKPGPYTVTAADDPTLVQHPDRRSARPSRPSRPPRRK